MRTPKQKWSWFVLILTSIIVLLVAEPAFTAPSQIDDREQGLRLLNLKRYQEAEKQFDQVLQVNPTDPKGYHYRGMARLYQNNLNGASKDFQQALKLTPTDTHVMASLGKVYFQAGQTAKSIKILDQAVKVDPKNYKAINQLAWVLAVTPQKKFRNGTRAVALAKRLISKEENVHTLDTLAAAYAANKEFRKAVSVQEKTVAILTNRGLSGEIGPYMERLKKYRKNQSWQYPKTKAKVPANAKIKDKPRVGKPVAKSPVMEKPVATPQQVEKTAVARSQSPDPKVTKTHTAVKPPVNRTVVKTPAENKPVVKPQSTEKAMAAKTERVTPKVPLVTKKRPSSLLAKKLLKKSSLQVKPSQPFFPYTVQIASFRDGQKAFYIANYLRQKGNPAFTAPITLEANENWHRVLFGWYSNSENAHKQISILKERQFREPTVVMRPYAVLIESTKDMNQLERIERRLKKMGQLPYRLSDRKKKGYWRMLVGAYSDKSIPTDFAEMLRQNGFQPVMVIR